MHDEFNNRHFEIHQYVYQIVIKITILKHLITVLVFISMNNLIMILKVGNKNCIKASDVKLITFLIR